MRNQIGVLLLLFCLQLGLYAQSQYPQSAFGYPLDTPLVASAPFGSLRENHFHSGMDIRTQEREGLPVYAVADGFVSRIKYSSVGYGKAIYIQHPNGYTSVYGHLQKANGEIAAYTKTYQYQLKRFEFDHFPIANQLQVKKGDIIGWSGNSGTSSGPHLHFEIRNSRTEEIINPRLFGIHFMDAIKPNINKVVVFQNSAFGMKQAFTLAVDSILFTPTDSGWMAKQLLKVPFSTVGFGLQASDWITDYKNQVSIYKAVLSIDGKLQFAMKLDRFAFSDSKSINVHIDYEYFKQTGERIQKLCLDDGNTIRIYPFVKNKGWYGCADTAVHLAKILVADFDGQEEVVYLPFQWTGNETGVKPPDFKARVLPRKKTELQLGEFTAQFSTASLFDTLYVKIEKFPEIEKGLLSSAFAIYPFEVPLQQAIAVSLKPTIFVDSLLQPKLIMLQQQSKGKWRSIGGEWDGKQLTANATGLGVFAIGIDTISPLVVVPVKNNQIQCDSASLLFTISDFGSGICCYELLVNNKWVLVEYDAKNDELRYDFDENTPIGKLLCELTVWDKRNNQTKKSFTINRK